MEKTVKRDLVIGVLVTIAYAIAGTMFGESVSNVMSPNGGCADHDPVRPQL